MRRQLLFILLIPTLLFAYTKIDSLKQELKEYTGHGKLQVIKNIVYFYDTSSPDSALHYCKKGLILAESTKDTVLQVFFLLQGSQYLYMQGFIKEAFENAKNALIFSEKTRNSSQIAYSYLTLGVYYFSECDIESAKESIEKSKNIFKKLEDNYGLIWCYSATSSLELFLSNYNSAMENNLKALLLSNEDNCLFSLAMLCYDTGHIYYDLKNFPKSLMYYQKAQKIFSDQNNNFYIGMCLLSIGKLFYSISQLDSAKIYSNRGYEIFKKVNFEIHYPYFLTALGDIELSFGNIKEALDYFENSLFFAKKYKNSWYKSYSLQRLGYYYFIEKDYNRAINLYLKSNFLAKKIRSKDISLDNYLLISKCYEKIGNSTLAIENLNKYISLKDSIFFMNQHNITDLQVKYHTENVIKEKEILQKDNAILKLEADKQRLLKTRFFLGFALVTLLAMIVFYLYRHKQQHNRILQQRIEKALSQQREQQEIITHQASITALGELAAGIAHEINQPLQNINLNAESIGLENKKRQIPDQEISQNVQEISGYVERIHSIIEHIRLFTSCQQEEYCQWFSINESIENAYRMVGKQFSGQGISVRLELDRDLPRISGNPYQYERVVLNLMSNARNAVEEKGKRVNGGYRKEIVVKSYSQMAESIVEVKDNGIGINEGVLSKIFKPFYSTKKLGEGQGLGLSIANRTIRGMGGRIEVQSEILLGTTFRVVVPHGAENWIADGLEAKNN